MNFKLKEKKEVVKYQNKVTFKPLLSISVVTYQHVNFIKQCLDSILMQKTNFDFEILLGEDASADGTREICIEYAKKYPDKIRLFLHNRKNNIKIAGQPTGRFNMLYNLNQAKGKYIALCEGDDYWTDPLKLQKQVDFLEENEEFSICGHKVMILRDNQLTESTINKLTPLETDIADLIEGNYLHTLSVVFKNNNFKIPNWFKEAPVGDWPLHLLNAKYGKIKLLNEIMGVYRHHCGGIFSTKNTWELEEMISFDQSMILLYYNLIKELKGYEKCEKILQKKIVYTYNNLRINFCRLSQYNQSQLYAEKILKSSIINVKLYLSALFNFLFPQWYGKYINRHY